jgi:mono/diheme cytochrome c family protein
MNKLGSRCSRCFYLAIALIFGMTFALVGSGWAQAEAPEMIPGETSVTTGKLEYRNHCASCHGTAGKGDGPVAAVLTKKPADLTALAKNNGGTFPERKVISFINGSEMIVAHGTRAMPIWGMEFSKDRPGAPRKSAAVVDARIKMLADYVKSIQEK